MLHARERDLVVAYARRLGPDGLAVSTAGNLSVRTAEHVVVTPTATPYEILTTEQVSVVDADGNLVDGDPPTSELPMHLAAYRATDQRAIVHTHPPYATALGLVADELPAIHYLVAILGGPVPVVPYAPPGSDELADAVEASITGRGAVLLRNHGALTAGPSLRASYDRALLLEWLCTVVHHARAIGEPATLGPQELAEVAQRLAGYEPS